MSTDSTHSTSSTRATTPASSPRPIPDDYIERLYAGWLGKLIGIRHGAPVEGWTYDKIRDTYGPEVEGYLVEYDDFAADDDSNGTHFFLRALGDYDYTEALTPQEIGLTWLNYAPWGHGFFWWGGYGISTEHTAYENLRHGIEAPRSGSIAQNGKAVAEQIGGQIFIDGWGLVNPGDPERAARYARKAASVGHGGNAVFAGTFIAAAVSAAFVEPDITSVIRRAAAFVPEDSELARMARDVTAWYRETPEDWRACFRKIQANYGYDRYPGNCHIIPNAAVVLMALWYSKGDFARGINTCLMAGWDTDCNVGNVGAILGTLNGLEGIAYDTWIRPMHDLTICSTLIGDLNAMDIPYAVRYMAYYAYRMAGQEVPARWRSFVHLDPNRLDFELPGSTHSFRVEGAPEGRLDNTDRVAAEGERSLCITVRGLKPLDRFKVYRKTYFRPADLHDGREQPAFSPTVYPGETLSCRIRLGLSGGAVSAGRLRARLFATDDHRGEDVVGPEDFPDEDGWTTLQLTLPPGDGRIARTGVLFTVEGNGEDGSWADDACALVSSAGDREGATYRLYLDDWRVTGTPDYCLDFAKEEVERWPHTTSQITQCTFLKGQWTMEDGVLRGSSADIAELYTGRHNFEDYRVRAVLRPMTPGDYQLLFRVQGAIRSYAAALTADGRLALRKNANGYRDLASTPFAWTPGETYTLGAWAEGSALSIRVGETTLHVRDEDAPYLRGAVGLSLLDGASCFAESMEVRPL